MALTVYERWRKLSDDERRQLEDGPLKPYLEDVGRSAQELYAAARHDRAARGDAVVELLNSMQTLLDVVVVRFGSGPATGGAPAFA